MSFQVARLYNVAAGLGRFIFPMLPVIPDDLMAHGSSLIRSMKKVCAGRGGGKQWGGAWCCGSHEAQGLQGFMCVGICGMWFTSQGSVM